MPDEPRPTQELPLEAFLSYTTDDDGLWLNYNDQRVSLGFDPTVAEVLEATRELTP